MTKTRAKRDVTKTKTNAKRSITKASNSKTSATKTSNPTPDDIGLLVLGFDEQQKPCGARFVAFWSRGWTTRSDSFVAPRA